MIKHSSRQFGDYFPGLGCQSEKFSRTGACIGRNFMPCGVMSVFGCKRDKATSSLAAFSIL